MRGFRPAEPPKNVSFLLKSVVFLPHLMLLRLINLGGAVVVVEFFEDVVVEVAEVVGLREGTLYERVLGV